MSLKRNKFRVKTGDIIYVTTGKEKGKTGKILKILANENKAIVEKLNIVKRHTKPTQKAPAGGIVEKEAGIHISNLMLYDEGEKKGVKVGYKMDNGKKVRINKKTGKEI